MPKRKAGAQPGNMSRLAPRNRWRAWIARRALKPSDAAWLAPLLRHYSDELLDDHPAPTAAERRMVEIATLARGGACLVLDALKAVTPGSADLMPLLSTLTRVLQLERATLGDLGLQRKARPADDVMALLAAPAEDAQLTAPPVK